MSVCVGVCFRSSSKGLAFNMIFFFLCWEFQIAVRHRGPKMSPPDIFWGMLVVTADPVATIGPYWPLLATIGPCWPLLATIGPDVERLRLCAAFRCFVPLQSLLPEFSEACRVTKD